MPKSELDARGSLAQGVGSQNIYTLCHGWCVSKNKYLLAVVIDRRSSLSETHYIQRGPSKGNLFRPWTKISQVVTAKKLSRILFLSCLSKTEFIIATLRQSSKSGVVWAL